MADIFRGPLVVGRRDAPLSRTTLAVSASLLATTLAGAGQIPLPLGAAKSLPTLQHRKDRLTTDTSRGMAIELRGIVQPRPQPNPSSIATPVARALGAGTHAGAPLTLLAPAVLPRPQPNPSSVSTPWGAWQNRDTSQTSIRFLGLDPIASSVPESINPPRFQHGFTNTTYRNKATLDAVIVVPPVVPGLLLAPLSIRDIGDETSSSARAIRDVVAAAPVVNLQYAALGRLADAPAQQAQWPKALYADATAPTVNALDVARYLPRLTSDTTAGTPATVRTVVIQAPVVNLAQGLLPFMRTLAETSAGTPPTLRPVVQVPVANPPQSVLPFMRPLAETSLGTAPTLRPVIVPAPIANAPQLQTYRLHILPDTSIGTAKTLRADSRLPVFNAPQFLPHRKIAVTVQYPPYVANLPYTVTYQFTADSRARVGHKTTPVQNQRIGAIQEAAGDRIGSEVTGVQDKAIGPKEQ